MRVEKVRGRAALFSPDAEEFAHLWLQRDVSLMDLARRYEVSVSSVRNYAQRVGLPRKAAPVQTGEQWFPTPQEIEQRCAEIRQTWPPERYRSDLA